MSIEEEGRKAKALQHTMEEFVIEGTATGSAGRPSEESTADETMAIRQRLRLPEEVSATNRTPQPQPKPYCIAVTVTLYYEFPKEVFPPWANPASVTKMVEEAFNDFNRDITLSAFGGGGALKQLPVEISVDRVMEG